MWQTVQTILERRQLPLHGVCAFDDAANALLPCRAAARLPANAARILVTLFPYRFTDSGARNLSRYACVPDYHIAAGDWLRETAQELAAALPDWHFEPFIDNSPIPEVKAAALAGLGCIGDNGLLLHPQYGSWVFIGTIVTDAPLPCSSVCRRATGAPACPRLRSARARSRRRSRHACGKTGWRGAAIPVRRFARSMRTRFAHRIRAFRLTGRCSPKRTPLN